MPYKYNTCPRCKRDGVALCVFYGYSICIKCNKEWYVNGYGNITYKLLVNDMSELADKMIDDWVEGK